MPDFPMQPYQTPQMPMAGAPAMPPLPKFGGQNLPSLQNMDARDIMNLLSTNPGSLTNTALPSAAAILTPSGPGMSPFIDAIYRRGEANAASAQSDAMRRGMTGSDIESAGMLGARQGASQEAAQVYGQGAQSLAQMIMQSMGYDIGTNKEMYQSLAQAIGQYLAQQQQLRMFQDMIHANMQESNAAGNMALGAAGIGGLSSIGSAMLLR